MTPTRAAAAVERSKSPAATLLENIPDPSFVLTGRGLIEYANGAAERLFDTSAAELAGKLFPTLLGNPFARQYETILNALAAGETQPMLGQPRAVVVLARDGSRVPVELSMSEVRVGDARSVVAVARELGVDFDHGDDGDALEPLSVFPAATPAQVG